MFQQGARLNPRCWHAGVAAISCLLFSGSASAQTGAFLVEEPSPWDQSLNLRTGLGYKDNLALSPTNREHSVFVLNALDLSILRLPLDGRQVTVFVTGEDTRFLQGHEVKYEQYLAALAEFKTDLGPLWNAGASLHYIYQDQVLDVSSIQVTPGPVRVQGHRVGLSPSLRRDFRKDFWIQIEPGLARQFFKQPLDDYWEPGARLTLGHNYGFKSAISVSYEIKQLIFDTREQAQPDGTVLAGHSLKYTQHEIDLSFCHNWDAQRRWRTMTRLNCQLNEDNGPGFYDYDRYQASQQIRYVDARWDLKGSARVSYYDFAIQPATTSNLSPRAKTLLTFSFRGERKLTKNLKLFTEFEHERSSSNRPAEKYHVNRIVGGIDFEL
jgi:hypothetical protein